MRWLETAFIGALFAGASYALFWARRRVRSTPADKSEDMSLRVAALSCLALFIVVNLSDWPGTVLAQFWADHAILAATASTLPLLGVGYFAFEAHDQVAQSHLDTKVAATGRGGVVNHLIDIDVALSLLTWQPSEIKRRWPGYGTDARSLTWLREGRDLLGREEGGGILTTDPRRQSISDDFLAGRWHRDLITECVRRVMTGIKEWGPVLGQSSDGQQDLVSLGEVRLTLLPMIDPTRALVARDVRRLQLRCRALALGFECRSGARQHLRPQLLMINEEEASDVGTRESRIPARR